LRPWQKFFILIKLKQAIKLKTEVSSISSKIALVTLLLSLLLLSLCILATSTGSTGSNIAETLTILFGKGDQESIVATIIWKIRLPRVILAGVVGSTLALGGLVFQALLRNPLAEPYILGISGGSAIGAILAMLLGLTHFPGVTVFSFAGSIAVLGIVIVLASRTMGSTALSKDSLLLGGVMMNAFCAAVIMFLISMVRTFQVQHILFWLMGDLSIIKTGQLPILLLVIPCFAIVFILARPMNLLLLGKETAAAMGINVRITVMLLLVVTSFMVSVVVSFSGLIGFVGLVIPHIFRLLIGPDHRVLVPACILGGASYLVLCDLLARILPSSGEMPVGIITALIGAPLFIFLLLRTKK
jgi:iron complex transport system permease protein